jgi:Protein of unknown function (DUF4236)
MGFYLRKSVKVGPLRFNFSKSGIGVSAGVRGLRIGTGPRGNYIHMGRYGLYYRQTLPSVTRPSHLHPALEFERQPPIPANTHDPLTEIESADVSQMVDSSSAKLLAELNEKQKKMRLWPVVTGAGILLFVLAVVADWPLWALALVTVCVAVGIFVAVRRDQFTKTVVLFYDFDEEMEQAYQLLHDRAALLAASAKIWHVEASGRVRDRKYHAGASHLIRRKPTTIHTAEPPYVKTNISTVAIGVGRQTLHFFPDRLLIYDAHGVGGIAYPALQLEEGHTRFVEDGAVPHDAQVVDRTWQYVNKNGGPDRRFKNNRQLPVCLYNELSLRSDSGLNELIQLSKADVAGGFVQAVEGLAKRLHQAQEKRT